MCRGVGYLSDGRTKGGMKAYGSQLADVRQGMCDGVGSTIAAEVSDYADTQQGWRDGVRKARLQMEFLCGLGSDVVVVQMCANLPQVCF